VGQWRRGNLTLAACNGTPSNNPFERKRQTYERSHLELNRSPAVHEAWGSRGNPEALLAIHAGQPHHRPQSGEAIGDQPLLPLS
jgi:hypothetical protein